jgi:hypothetical protein
MFDWDKMSAGQFKTLENRLRRVARRNQMVLCKTRSKTVADYYGGWMICDSGNMAVVGGTPAFSMSLQDVCEYLEVKG